MSPPSDIERLRHMVQHAELAMDLVRGRTEAEFTADRHLRAACERYIEIVGEAANHVSRQLRPRLVQLPWTEIIRTRNILAHGYMIVRTDILWEITQSHLPTLVDAVKGLLAELADEHDRGRT